MHYFVMSSRLSGSLTGLNALLICGWGLGCTCQLHALLYHVFLVTYYCASKTTHKRLEVQDPHQSGKGRGTEFGMHLGLVETGYEDKKVRVKTKEADPAKQVQFTTL